MKMRRELSKFSEPTLRLVIRTDVVCSSGEGSGPIQVQPGDLLDGLGDGTEFDIRRAWRQGENWVAPVGGRIPESSLFAPPYGAPERQVKTRSLNVGSLFMANGLLYQVIEPTPEGFYQAKPWGGCDTSIVALDPAQLNDDKGIVVADGEPVPYYLKRTDLLDEKGSPIRFRFPTKALAFQAASLDQLLAERTNLFLQAYGPMAYALTDGSHRWRYYYYSQAADMLARAGALAQDKSLSFNYNYADGPAYWQYIFDRNTDLPHD
jgi:hypothetical protein